MNSNEILNNDDLNRRFTGTQNLYGDAFERFANACVYVVGVGGVGSWAAEALARTGVGEIVLVDLDVLVASNVNRQLPALSQTFGESKIAAMAERIAGINPTAKVRLVDDFLTKDNIADILPNKEQVLALKQQGKTVVVLDCVDDMDAKLAMALYCRYHKIKYVIAGGAGAKIDPTRIRVCDLKDVIQDPLLAKLRYRLRQKGIGKDGQKFALKCVYSDEQPKVNRTCQAGLNCGGYGSAVAVTATMGMVMASTALQMIASGG